MPRKAKYSNKRVCCGISNLVPHASSQGHSTPVVPPLKPSKAVQPRAPAITFIPPSIPTAQNLVSPSDAPSSMPRKAKLSRGRASLGISNFMPHALSQGCPTHVEPPQSCVPAYSATIPLSIPKAQNLVSASDLPLRTMPRKAKLSRERASLGMSNLMPYASSHGHSTHVEPPLQPSQVSQSCAPTITLVPPSIPTAQNLVSPSDPPLHTIPRKAKHSKKRGSHGISNLMPHASSQGHSTHVEPPLQPSLARQSCAPAYSTAIPPSIPTAQNLVSASDPPLRTMSRKAKHSKKRGSHDILNLMPYASSQEHSTHVEPLLQPSELAQQSYAPTISHIPSSIPTALDPLSPSEPPSCLPPKNVFSGILNLMRHASSQGYSITVESPQHPSKLAQPCAPTITDIPPSIPTAQDLVSPSTIPSHSMPRRYKCSKKRVSRGISNLMPHTSSQGHSIPMELPLQPSELAQPCASPVVIVPSSIPLIQDPVSPSDPSSIPVTQDPVSPSDPSSSPVTQDTVSPFDPSLRSTSDIFVLPSTLTRQPLVPYRGQQWTVQAIDEHGNTKEIQVTKPGMFVMPPGQRIVVPFDRQLRAYGEAATLLSGACGRIVTDSKNIPINFDSWPKVPKSYKDDCYNILKVYP
ncbi:flocculation protein FLO1 isoform X1 [Spatholobus suberectus]|nr:flocculation protein FLO1 isoform X1 [Spatholobus suberectus]